MSPVDAGQGSRRSFSRTFATSHACGNAQQVEACGFQHLDDVLVGVLGLRHDVALMHVGIGRRVDRALAGHEQEPAGAHRGAVGELLVARPARVDRDSRVARGDEIALDQRLAMQEPRHHDAYGGRVDRTEVLPSHARRASIVRSRRRRDVFDRLHDTVEAEAESGEHPSGALEDGACLRDDVTRAHDVAAVVHRLDRRKKHDAGGRGLPR